jgi:hypothetical protein
VGSKAHLSESCDEGLPRLVTDVHTTGATDPDVTATTAIQDRLIARDLAPGEHLMDAGYPSAEVIAASAQRGITLIAPVIVSTGRNARAGTFTPADFTIDWEGGTARCPAGARSRSMKEDDRGLIRFAFSRSDCGPCPIRGQCTRAKNGAVRNIAVHPQPVHEARMRALQAQGTDEWLVTYNARAGIEGTISRATRRRTIRVNTPSGGSMLKV